MKVWFGSSRKSSSSSGAPTNGELLNSIFRTVHTVKGTCGFFEFRRLERVAHACETVLALVREGRLDASRPVRTAVLEAVDVTPLSAKALSGRESIA